MRVGVIGLGMGVSLLPLNRMKDTALRVGAICSARPQREAEELLSEWNVDFYTNDFHELVSRSDVDVIAVFSPDRLHFDHCRAALGAGKHLVCTKPLVEDLREAEELKVLSEEAGVKTFVAQTFRFEPSFLKLCEYVNKKMIGDIRYVESSYVHDMGEMYRITPWRLEKNWLIGAGCHPLDAAQVFIDEVEELHAFGMNSGVSAYTGMDNIIVNMSGTTIAGHQILSQVKVIIGCVQPVEPMQQISVYGTRGSAAAHYTDLRGGALRLRSEILQTGGEELIEEFGNEPGVDRYGHTATLCRMMRYFENCILEGTRPRPDIADGYKTVLLSQAARESMESHESVAIKKFSKGGVADER